MKSAEVGTNSKNTWNIPIEVKPYDKPDLWTAIHKQLIPRYVRDPGTAGYGIYLVFWFGNLKGRNVKRSPIGESPKNPTQLEAMLYAQLSCEERQHVQIRVIDCSLVGLSCLDNQVGSESEFEVVESSQVRTSKPPRKRSTSQDQKPARMAPAKSPVSKAKTNS